jgi:hypothetical protein
MNMSARNAMAALALCAGLLAGCGSSAHQTVAAAQPSSAAAAHSPESRPSKPPADATTSARPGPGDPASTATFCRAISQNLAFLTTAATSPDNPTLDEGIRQINRLADGAPTEIRGDLRLIAQFDQRLLPPLRAGQSPDSIEETPELTAALTHEAQWTAAHCAR